MGQDANDSIYDNNNIAFFFFFLNILFQQHQQKDAHWENVQDTKYIIMNNELAWLIYDDPPFVTMHYSGLGQNPTDYYYYFFCWFSL